jgi:4-amino-4-deoxychorismate lyase
MVLVNGVEDAGVPAHDRAVAYGDGVFRTVEVRAGVARHWELHYAKLAADCACLDIPCPDAAVLRDEVLRICRIEHDCALKVIVSRGAGARGYRYNQSPDPSRIVISAPLPDYPERYCDVGVRVRLCALRLAQQPALAGVKHLNRLENVLARAEWDDSEVAEGLLLDGEGNIIGGTMTNIFISRPGALVTPKLDRCGVAGITRDRVIRAAMRRGVACHVGNITWRDVLDADEVILVNSLAGAWPVREIEGSTRTPGPVVRAVQQWLAEDDAQNG